MIEYISGKLVELTPTYAVIDCNGIGYLLNISLSSFVPLEAQMPAGAAAQTPAACPSVKLLVYEIIREDAHMLYGFLTAAERKLFELLIGVSGVGANTARMLLSSIQTAELESVIMTGDSKRLKAVKGVGTKTAERIIVDLRDKIKSHDDTLVLQPAQLPAAKEVYEEALSALLMLGFARPQSQKVLGKIFDADPAIKVETAIKRALTMM